MVAVIALVALVLIVVIGLTSLPPADPKNPGQNGSTIVAIATASFGVIGAVVGAFFAVRSAGGAIDEKVEQRKELQRARDQTNDLARRLGGP